MTLALNRDLMLISGGRLASVLIALISMRVVTSLLTPQQYGELVLLMIVPMFCGLFLVNPVGMYLNLHTHSWWDDGTLWLRLRSYRGYILAVSFIGGALTLGMTKQHSSQELLCTALVMFVMIATGTWNATFVPMLNMLGFRMSSVLWGTITLIGGLTCSIFFYHWLTQSVTSWIAGQAVGMMVGALGARYVLQRHKFRTEFSGAHPSFLDKKTILTYCLPLALATGLMWLQLSGYRFLIEAYWGLTELAFLAIGLQVAGQVWSLVESLATQFLYPLFYRQVSEKEGGPDAEMAFSDLINSLIPVYIVLAGSIISGAPYLLRVLVAPEFQQANIFLMLGAGIEMCRVLGNLFSNAAHVNRKTKSLTVPYAIGATISLGFIYIVGEKRMDISWAGISLLIGGAMMLLSMALEMHRQIRFSLDVSRCIASFSIILIMLLIHPFLPMGSDLFESIVTLLCIGLFASIAMMMLLWKNPAVHRLLNVKLRK